MIRARHLAKGFIQALPCQPPARPGPLGEQHLSEIFYLLHSIYSVSEPLLLIPYKFRWCVNSQLYANKDM
jgi:hypothetical protein